LVVAITANAGSTGSRGWAPAAAARSSRITGFMRNLSAYQSGTEVTEAQSRGCSLIPNPFIDFAPVGGGVHRSQLTLLRGFLISMPKEKITVAGGKRHRTLPIYGDMKSALESQKQEREEKYPALEWVFHDGCGQRLRTFYKAWNSACRRAKLSGQLFHDLRRSAVRNMVRAGIPEKVAMAISGHRTRHVF